MAYLADPLQSPEEIRKMPFLRPKVRESGTTAKYSKWHFPAEKSLDFPPWGLLTFSGNPVICAVKCRFLHAGSGGKYCRILERSFRVAVKGSPKKMDFWGTPLEPGLFKWVRGGSPKSPFSITRSRPQSEFQVINLFLCRDSLKDVVKFSEVAGVTNFKPDFLGKKERKFATQNPPGFSRGWGGCKNPKFHHLDLLGPPLLNILVSKMASSGFPVSGLCKGSGGLQGLSLLQETRAQSRTKQMIPIGSLT